eukprot:5623734-Karenia_brevis.AAC.1
MLLRLHLLMWALGHHEIEGRHLHVVIKSGPVPLCVPLVLCLPTVEFGGHGFQATCLPRGYQFLGDGHSPIHGCRVIVSPQGPPHLQT